MGVSPQYPRSPPPPPRDEARGSKVQEGGMDMCRSWRDCTSPIRERGMPEDQAQAIVAQIINVLPGNVHTSGQTKASTRQAQHIRGAWGRGSRGRSVRIGGGRLLGVRGGTGGQIRRPPVEGPNTKMIVMSPEMVGKRWRRKRMRRGVSWKETGTEIPQGGHRYRSLAWGGKCPPRRKRRPPGIPPTVCWN